MIRSEASEAPKPAVTPQIIADRYRTTAELGSGGAGTVYRVIDAHTGAQLALKCLRRDKCDARVVALFRHEYQTLAGLMHPRIVRAYEFGVWEGIAYYTMELIDGLDVREAAPLPAAEVCRLLRDVASALAMLHARRLLHRDVSYRNVRCTSSGHAKLIDFGAMTSIGTATEVIGTPPFIAPEMLRGGTLDSRSDLYSLGALAYWMLTARHAYPASGLSSLQHVWAGGAPPAPSELVEHVSPELDALVMSLLCHEPQGRPASAGEVMDRLGAIGNLPPAEDLRVARAYLARPALVGRAREQRRIGEFCRRETEARGPLLIEGSEGLGKTRLLEELALEAKLSGALSIWAAGQSALGERYAIARAIVEQLLAHVPGALDRVRDEDRGALATEFPAFQTAWSVPPQAIPPGELRHRVQLALARWVLDVTRPLRVVIAVDDVHAVDDESAALLGALAADASGHLSLAVSVLAEERVESPAVRLLRQLGTTLQLLPLREGDVSQLIDSMFGEVPNRGRVAHWLFSRTRGNPLQCVELTHYLVERELVHYAEGTWILPATLPREVPQGLHETRLARIAGLPEPQRAIAEALAVFGVPASSETCAKLVEIDEASAVHTLDALLRLELLTLESGGYSYRSDALREAIERSLESARAEALHERAGRVVRDEGGKDMRTAVRAAHHLMRGRSRLQGVEMILALARDPSIGRDAGEFFTRPVELALSILLEHRRPPADTLPLRVRLLNAGYMYDRNLVCHVHDALPQLRHDTGLDLLTPADLERPDWLSIMIARAAERYASLPPAERGLPPREALPVLENVAGVVLAASILKWDSDLIELLWETVAPMARLGTTDALSASPELVAIYLDALRIGEASNHEKRVSYVQRMRDPDFYRGLPMARRHSLLSTQLHNIGMATSVLDGETALQYAGEIDALGAQMFKGAAMQVRFMVYMYRGEIERAQQCRAQLDVLALQGGAGTQFELWLAPYLADPYALCDDILGLKQAAAHLRRLAQSDPGYAPWALIAAGHYDRVRGDHVKAREIFERARELAPRDRHGAWLLALTGHVDTLVEAGAHEAALDLGVELSSSANYAERFTAIIEHRLARSMVLARAHLGRIDEALADCDRAIEKELGRGRSPLHLGRLHEARAHVVMMQDDDQAFAVELGKVREYFSATQNAVLIKRHERLASAGRTRFGAAAAGGFGAAEGHFREPISTLARLEDPRARAQRALDLISRELGVDSALLYLSRGPDLELAATGSPDLVPEGLRATLTTLLQDQETAHAADITVTLSPDGEQGPAITTIMCGQREFMTLPLAILREGERSLVGVVALPMEQPRTLSASQWRLLDSIARTLYEAGDVGG